MDLPGKHIWHACDSAGCSGLSAHPLAPMRTSRGFCYVECVPCWHRSQKAIMWKQYKARRGSYMFLCTTQPSCLVGDNQHHSRLKGIVAIHTA